MKIITTDSEDSSILYKTAQAVDPLLSAETVKKIEAMRVFYKSCGDKAGFAAPQVGISERIILVEADLFDPEAPDTNEPIILINPEWRALTDKKELDIEGCLSVPGKVGMVMRYTDVELTGWLYCAETGKLSAVKRKYIREFSSVLWQHEIDHLNGKIYSDKAVLVLDDEEGFALRQYLTDSGQIHEGMTLFDMGPLIYSLALRRQQAQPEITQMLSEG